MRYDYLTPHHFQPMSPYFDTSLLLTVQPQALDVAVPHGASRWIAQELARRIQSRFLGRMSTIDIGYSALTYGIEASFYEAVAFTTLTHEVRFGVVLLDRQAIQPFTQVRGSTGKWLFVDWWKWFHWMVPKARLSDVWMYLCHACPAYWSSSERRGLRISEDLALAMQSEGNRMFDAVVSAVCTEIAQLWDGDVMEVDS